MGWLDSVKNFGSKVGGWVSKRVGDLASTVKRVGEWVSPIARKIGQYAGPLASALGSGVDLASIALGQPEGLALGETLRRGGNWISDISNRTADISDKAIGIANNVHNLANNYSGGG
jgi:hypothetical protein